MVRMCTMASSSSLVTLVAKASIIGLICGIPKCFEKLKRLTFINTQFLCCLVICHQFNAALHVILKIQHSSLEDEAMCDISMNSLKNPQFNPFHQITHIQQAIFDDKWAEIHHTCTEISCLVCVTVLVTDVLALSLATTTPVEISTYA